ncbi:hypothetical protein C8J57DRAFT_1734444 [Mycena rebaudengoi]|nr:hypothetical protein C8J57DRAFT_1734444 [Mycena rebaudengoi]
MVALVGTLHRIALMRRVAHACPCAAFAHALTPTPCSFLRARIALVLARVALMHAYTCAAARAMSAVRVPLYDTLRSRCTAMWRGSFSVSRFLRRGARSRLFLHARIALMLSPAPHRACANARPSRMALVRAYSRVASLAPTHVPHRVHAPLSGCVLLHRERWVGGEGSPREYENSVRHTHPAHLSRRASRRIVPMLSVRVHMRMHLQMLTGTGLSFPGFCV